MKFIPYTSSDRFPAVEVIRGVATVPPKGAGVRYDEIIKRGRILDALERDAKKDGLMLEDADHAHLVGLVKAFDFSTADTELRNVLTAIVDAADPPAARAVA